MKLGEIKRALEILGVPVPRFVETDAMFSTWEYGTDLWFRWDRPVGYKLPAVLWNGTDGLMRVKEVRDEGAAHKGIVWPMTGKYLVQHLFFGSLPHIRVPYDVERLRLALEGIEMAPPDEAYEKFDREAAAARTVARGSVEGAEEYAVAFGGNIMKSYDAIERTT